MEPEEKKTVVFICYKFPMLRMVYKKSSTVVIDGIVVRSPTQYLGFLQTSYGGRYETSDPDIIKHVRGSEKYAEGDIVEFDGDLEKLKEIESPLAQKVNRGGCFVDVKSAFDAAALRQAGLCVWRL
jgi:hypothetical protein